MRVSPQLSPVLNMRHPSNQAEQNCKLDFPKSAKFRMKRLHYTRPLGQGVCWRIEADLKLGLLDGLQVFAVDPKGDAGHLFKGFPPFDHQTTYYHIVAGLALVDKSALEHYTNAVWDNPRLQSGIRVLHFELLVIDELWSVSSLEVCAFARHLFKFGALLVVEEGVVSDLLHGFSFAADWLVEWKVGGGVGVDFLQRSALLALVFDPLADRLHPRFSRIGTWKYVKLFPETRPDYGTGWCRKSSPTWRKWECCGSRVRQTNQVRPNDCQPPDERRSAKWRYIEGNTYSSVSWESMSSRSAIFFKLNYIKPLNELICKTVKRSLSCQVRLRETADRCEYRSWKKEDRTRSIAAHEGSRWTPESVFPVCPGKS